MLGLVCIPQNYPKVTQKRIVYLKNHIHNDVTHLETSSQKPEISVRIWFNKSFSGANIDPFPKAKSPFQNDVVSLQLRDSVRSKGLWNPTAITKVWIFEGFS